MSKALMALVAVGCLTAPAAAVAQVRCDVAQAALVDLFSGTPGEYALDGIGNIGRIKLFLDLAGPCLSRVYTGQIDDECYGWYGLSPDGNPAKANPPGQKTLEVLASAPAIDATVACPALRSATQSAIGWRRPSDKPPKRKRGRFSPYTSVGITLPVVTLEAEAVAWVDQYSGRLAGGSYLVLLRRDDEGRWRLAARFPMSVS